MEGVGWGRCLLSRFYCHFCYCIFITFRYSYMFDGQKNSCTLFEVYNYSYCQSVVKYFFRGIS